MCLPCFVFVFFSLYFKIAMIRKNGSRRFQMMWGVVVCTSDIGTASEFRTLRGVVLDDCNVPWEVTERSVDHSRSIQPSCPVISFDAAKKSDIWYVKDYRE